MKVLVRKEILDVLDEINQLGEKYFCLSRFIGGSDLKNAQSVAPVEFDITNCELMAIDSHELNDLLGLYHIDSNNILLVSTLLAHGFLATMQEYHSTLEHLITGKK